MLLGYFPRATRTAWKDGIGTHYLSVPAAGIACSGRYFEPRTHVSLAPSRYWEVLSSDVLALSDSEIDQPVVWTTETVSGLKPTESAAGEKATVDLHAGFNAARLAQLSLSRWEFKQAAAYYFQAAKSLDKLGKRASKMGLSDAPMRDYVQAFQTARRRFGGMDPAGCAAITSGLWPSC